jgi:glucuronate isomerase
MNSIQNLFLSSELSAELFEKCRYNPIIDYHSHLSPEKIFKNEVFHNITELWLRDDHYKWRALRLCGVDETEFRATGNDEDLFHKWWSIYPRLLMNPLYDWTRLEMSEYFGIHEDCTSKPAAELWERLNHEIKAKSLSPGIILKQANVRVICTSDDPTDDLKYHKLISENNQQELKVLPTFRLDKLFFRQNFNEIIDWIKVLGNTVGTSIESVSSLTDALEKRHEFFHQLGCRLSDHGLEYVDYIPCTKDEVQQIFDKLLVQKEVTQNESSKWNSYFISLLMAMNCRQKWTTLLHLGAIRNNNSTAYKRFGLDNGTDSIGDFSQAKGINRLLDHLESEHSLHKVILLNLNPADNFLFASIMGNFYGKGLDNKVQFGPAWWFLDTRAGIIDHLNAYSNLGIYSNFIGMVTDSRSFTSFIRHDYYRRAICDEIARKINSKELIVAESQVEQLLHNVTYQNALTLFD